MPSKKKEFWNMMNYQVRSSNGISIAPVDSGLFSKRKLVIEGEINAETAMEFIKALMLLVFESCITPIDVLINSPGGEINAGLAMYDAMRSCGVKIRTICIGRGYSMGAVLFAAGTGGRYMLPNSELMIHEPLIAGRLGGSSSTVKSISDSLIETKRKMDRILSECTGKTEKEIEEAASYDHYFSAEESISFGLADGIIGLKALTEVSDI